MSSRKYFVLVLASLIALIPTAWTLQCYKCDSVNNPGCDDFSIHAHVQNTPKIVCPETLPHQGATGSNAGAGAHTGGQGGFDGQGGPGSTGGQGGHHGDAQQLNKANTKPVCHKVIFEEPGQPGYQVGRNCGFLKGCKGVEQEFKQNGYNVHKCLECAGELCNAAPRGLSAALPLLFATTIYALVRLFM